MDVNIIENIFAVKVTDLPFVTKVLALEFT